MDEAEMSTATYLLLCDVAKRLLSSDNVYDQAQARKATAALDNIVPASDDLNVLALKDLLRQAVEFDQQTVRDAESMRKWRCQAMTLLGGYEVEAQRERDRKHIALLAEMWK